MLPLTRPYRQGLATLALVAVSVVPTVYVGLTAYRINRPGHVRDVEIEMGRSLGLQVTLEGVRYPTPGQVVYDGIVLRQEEQTQAGLTEVARATSLRLVKSGRTLTLEAEGLKLHGNGPKAAMTQVAALVGKSGEGAFDRVSLVAPNCRVELDPGGRLAFDLKELAATFTNDKTAPSLLASYRVSDEEGSTRCELEFRRDRRVDPVETTLTFRTMEGVPLPARMLDVFFDSSEWLGGSSRVQGTLCLRQSGEGDWKADFSGDLLSVDLGTLFAKQFPRHRLTGLARLAIKSAKWDDRPGQGFGWSDAEGEIVTGPGSIGLELLHALNREMRFYASRPISGAKPDVAFRTLAVKFKLDREGQIEFAGALPGEFAPDDVLVVNDRAALKSPQGAASVRGLIKTLVPVGSSEAMIPATAESQVLTRFLPMPKGGTLDPSAVKTLNAN